MKAYMNELRALRVEEFEKRSYIGSIGFGECKDKMFCAGRSERGPFTTKLEMHVNICERWVDQRRWANTKPDHCLQVMYMENSNHKIWFTHADWAPCNILVGEGHVVGIWQEAEWYPEYWEYVTIMHRCAGIWDSPWPLQVEKTLKPCDLVRLIDLPIRSQPAWSMNDSKAIIC